MNCVLKTLGFLCIISWAVAEMTYFHEPSCTEIRPPGLRDGTDFSFSMAYSSKKSELVIGAPRYDSNGKVFQCSLKEVFSKTASCTEIDLDMDKLAGDYSRELAPDHNFLLGSSIAVATDFILTCAPLWRTVVNSTKSMKLKYGTYGTCFVISNTVQRMKGAFEQLSSLENNRVYETLGKTYGGSGWSTLIDEANNITLLSLSPFSEKTDIGYLDTVPPLDSMKLMRIYKKFNHVFKDIGTFTSGRFFEDKKVTYAFSSRRKKMIGVVAFLQRPKKATGVWEVMENTHRNIPLYIEALDTEVGSMFGAALYACDLNADGFSDLLVGAPAQGGKDSLLYDSGAVHIFLGGIKKKIKERRTILFTKSGGHFGRTIATNDVDGDAISEVFVSAPFEDFGNGAVYIFNGQEIKNFVDKTEPFTVQKLTDFKLTQRVQNTNYKWFGYSLQPLPDLDDNGCTELAVGAPKSGKVLLYRSIPILVVNVSAVIDRDYVRQNDVNCSIHMKIIVTYPVKPEIIFETLVVSMNVVGNDVLIDGGDSIKQIIHSKQSTYEKDIVVKFSKSEPGVYQFNANVTLEADESGVFNKSRVLLSPCSNTTVAVTISRQCKGEDCVPILSPNIEFSGRESYVLGSSSSETVTVMILNKGDVTYDSCVKILVEGSEVLYINAEQDSAGWYQYLLRKPFVKGASHTMEMKVDMSKQTNLEKKLVITARLYNICNRGDFTEHKKEFPFVLSTKHIFVDGVSHHRNITDTEILDTKTTLITDDHIYTIVNNGSVMWKSIKAEIKIKKQKFIKAYHISKLESMNCNETEDEETFLFSCNVNLEKFLKVVVTLDIAKDMFKDSLEKGYLKTSSKFELDLQSDGHKKINQITTTFYYRVDKSLGQNKIVIIAIAVLLSAIILMTLTYVLYKSGFFKRPEKTMLEKLKHEERKQSIKRLHPSGFVFISKNPENVEGDETNAGQEKNERHEQNGGEEANEEHEINGGQEPRDIQEIC